MAREVDQRELPVYTGRFFWNTDRLRLHVELVVPEYNHEDPKSWPLVTSRYLEEQLGHKYDGAQLLPPYVAYERELVEKCVTHWVDQVVHVVLADGRTIFRRLFHHHFPFVYNSRGDSRDFEYMHADHYIAWVSGMTGKVPATRTKGKDAAASSASPSLFDEVLEMLKETRPMSATGDSDTTQQTLAEVQKQLADERERVEAMAKERDDTKNILEKKLEEERKRVEALAQSSKAFRAEMKKALDKEKREHTLTKLGRDADKRMLGIAEAAWDAASNRAEAAEVSLRRRAKSLDGRDKELRAAREEIKSQAEELRSAEKEAAMSKEQVRKIHEELRMMREGGAGKRPAGDETSRTREKKLKTDVN